jgi:DNA-binding NarL/FixJ family response regulator
MRLVLVTGEPLVRLGFRAGVASSGDLELIGDHADARAAFRAIDADRPDVVVMDVTLQGMNGISATREVRRRAPGARILLLSAWLCERDAREGFEAGADGFVLKTEPVEALLAAIRAVCGGKQYVSPGLRGVTVETAGVIRRARGRDEASLDVLDALSPREREVLDLLLKGWRNRAIARELCVSIKTVDTHRTRINRKLGCAGSPDLIRFAADNGLLRGSSGAAATGAAPEARTIVLLCDDDAELRGALARDIAGSGPPPARAASAAAALRELGGAEGASLCLVEGNGPLRAAASLPQGPARDGLVAALDRAAAVRRSPVGGGDATLATQPPS